MTTATITPLAALRQLEQDHASILNWAQQRREGFLIRRLDSMSKALDSLAAIHDLPTRADRELVNFRKRTKPKKPLPKQEKPKPTQRKAPRRKEVGDIESQRQQPRSWTLKSD